MKRNFNSAHKMIVLGAFILCALLVSALPTAAWAAPQPDISWYNTSDRSFTITTAEQLAGLAQIVNRTAYNYGVIGDTFRGKTITLGNDIDLTAYLADGLGWTPIGIVAPETFEGYFDGKGFKITGLWINRLHTSFHSRGLFGSVGQFGSPFGSSPGSIKDLGVEIAPAGIDGGSWVGGLAGIQMDGSIIENCYVTGNISASSVGGLVGSSSGIIKNSYATGNVNGHTAGGLVGILNGTGTITNSYATGDVISSVYFPSSAVGGLVGENSGNVRNSYATGNIDAPLISNVGGLVGNQTGGSIENSYRYEFATVNGELIAIDEDDSIHGGIVSASDLMKKTTYTGNGWFFKDTGDANPWIWDDDDSVLQFPKLGFGTERFPFPLITHPEDQTVTVGESATFSVTQAIGTPLLTYQWQRSNDDGDPWSNINGANTTTYSFTTQAPDNGARFRVVGRSDFHSVTSVAAILTLTPVISINTHPASTTVTQDSITGSLPVSASVSPSATLTYQWHQTNSATDNTSGTPINGATSANFAIPTNLTASGSPYYYYCVVSAPGAEPVPSNVSRVTVNLPVITIITQPTANTPVTQDSITGSLSVSASVTPSRPLTYLWYTNTTNSNTNGTELNITTYPTAATSSFTIPTTLKPGIHYYYCVVSADGAIPVSSNVATVVVENRALASPTLTFFANPAGSQTRPGDVTLTAVLSGALPNNLEKNITFTVNGTPQIFTTDTSGTATRTLRSPAAGTHSFVASFEGDDYNNPVAAAQINYTVNKVAQAALSIVGGDITRTYGDPDFTLSTSGGSGEGTLSWNSDKTAVATINSAGVVSITGVGQTVISVTKAADDNYNASNTAQITLTVLPLSVSGVRLNMNTLTLDSGLSGTLTAIIEPANASNKSVIWNSSNTSIASVNQSGVVTARNAGVATITVRTVDGNHTDTCVVTVRPVSVTGVRLNLSTFTLNATGTSVGLFAIFTPPNVTNKNVTWRSSDETLATVNQSGVVTANSANRAGVVTITATTEDGNYTASCVVTVQRSNETSVFMPSTKYKLSSNSIILDIGRVRPLAIIRSTVSLPIITIVPATWSSSDPTVAEVDASGLVRAVSDGTATITARVTDSGSEPVTLTCAVTVRAKPTIIMETLPTGRQWEPYGHTLSATGSEPITWSLVGGNLPDGLELSSNGVISGMPQSWSDRPFGFTVEATNSAGSDRMDFSITVPEAERLAPPTISYNRAFRTVSISSEPGAIIRFTKDGSEPTKDDSNPSTDTYDGSFDYDEPMLIKAKAFREGMRDSHTASNSFPFRIDKGFHLHHITPGLDDIDPNTGEPALRPPTMKNRQYEIDLGGISGFAYFDEDSDLMKIVIGEMFENPGPWMGDNNRNRNTLFSNLKEIVDDCIERGENISYKDLSENAQLRTFAFDPSNINMFRPDNPEERFAGIIGYATSKLDSEKLPTTWKGKIVLNYRSEASQTDSQLLYIRNEGGIGGFGISLSYILGGSLNVDLPSEAHAVNLDRELENNDFIEFAGEIELRDITGLLNDWQIIPERSVSVLSNYSDGNRAVEVEGIRRGNRITTEHTVEGSWDISYGNNGVYSTYDLNATRKITDYILCKTHPQCGFWDMGHRGHWCYTFNLVWWSTRCHFHGNKLHVYTNEVPCDYIVESVAGRNYGGGSGIRSRSLNNSLMSNSGSSLVNPSVSVLRNTQYMNTAISTKLPIPITAQTEPLIAEANGRQIMVFLAEDGSKIVDDVDRIRLMYSIYDNIFDAWSTPLPVHKEPETVDLHPSIASDGRNIWIAWQRFKTTLDENATLEDFLGASEIVAARFDNAAGSFGDTMVVTDSVFLDESPKIAVEGNELFVTWASDNNHVIYSLWGHNCGVDCEEDHSIKESDIEIIGRLFTNDAWSDPITLAGGLGMIVEMDAAFFGGKFQVAYITDADSSIETFYDRSLTVVDSSGSTTYAPAGGAQVLNPKFTVIDGAQVLSWFQGEIIDEENWTRYSADIRYMKADGHVQSLLGDSNMPTANYKILNNASGTAVIYPAAEGETELFYARLYKDGILGNPFKLVETENFVRYYDAAFNSNGEFNIVYNNSVVFRGDENNPVFIEDNDLRAVKAAVPVNIRIADLYYFERNTRLGETLPISMYIENIGGVPVDAIVIDVNGNAVKTIPISGGLQTGDTAAVEFELSIPPNMNELTPFVISVRPEGLDDADMSNNSRAITLGRSNLSLSLEKLYNEDGTVTVAADVRNLSDFSASAKLFVHQGSLDGKEIDSVELGEVVGRKNILTEFNFDPVEIVPAGNDFEVLHLRVESDKDEPSIANKSGFVVIYAAEVDETEPVPVTEVSLNKSTLSLPSGTSDKLTATVGPENATNKDVIWSITGDDTIATVNQSGVVTANSAGKTGSVTVTVKTVDGNYTANCVVTVTAAGTSSPANPTNNATINGQEIGLGINASGPGWSWNAPANTLTLTGSNNDLGDIAFDTWYNITIRVTGDTTVNSIVNAGTGNITIKSDPRKTLTLDSVSGPAIGATGDIVIESGTVRASTQDANASTIHSTSGSVIITGNANLTVTSSGGSAIKSAANIAISTSRNVIATAVGSGFALEAGISNNKITITDGTTQLFAADNAHAFNIDPNISGDMTLVYVNGKLYWGIEDDRGGCNTVPGLLIVLTALPLFFIKRRR